MATAKKPAKKTSAKQATAKKTAAKKTSAKTTAAKKTAAKKTTAKKTAAKKTAAKTTAAKKTARAAAPAKPPAPAKPAASVFAGKTVVLTGTFVTMKRAEAEAMLAKVGAKIVGSISRNTDLLIHGADAGSKLSKAQGLGVALMNETDMLAALQAGGAPAGLADKVRAQREADAHKLGPAKATIDTVHAAQVDRYGLTIGQLLRCWLRVFAQRPDIHVRWSILGDPTPAALLARLAASIPAQVLALAAEIDTLHFCWIFKDKLAEAEKYSEGHSGGRINLVGLCDFRWWPRPEDWDWADWEAQAAFDSLQAEGSTFLSYDPGEAPTDAILVFDDANDNERYAMGTVEEYLTLGARRAFVWYWPRQEYWEANDFIARLADASLPRTAPAAAIVAGLQARGLDEAEARAVHRWLGRDAVLLLPK